MQAMDQVLAEIGGSELLTATAKYNIAVDRYEQRAVLHEVGHLFRLRDFYQFNAYVQCWPFPEWGVMHSWNCLDPAMTEADRFRPFQLAKIRACVRLEEAKPLAP